MKCLFEDPRDRKAAGRPCARCKKRKRPFGGRCAETKSRFEWWAAEFARNHVVFFRCFPTSRHLPRTPQARLDYIGTEFANAWDAAERKICTQFRDNPKRGIVWAIPALNAMFARLLGPDGRRKPKFRPATACEVAAWLSGHKDDFLAMSDGERIIGDLERYVP